MGNKERGEQIRRRILRDLNDHPADIVNHIGQIFSISPQAVANHIRLLEDSGYIETTGSRKGKRYFPGDLRYREGTFNLDSGIEEYEIWRDYFSMVAEGVKEHVYDICHYGFTEMVNNVIDHSAGSTLHIRMDRSENYITIDLMDNGEGIFRRIKRMAELDDERESLLELSKGKFTTDPENHTGEGIFFTSRAFDKFVIDSKGLRFSHDHSQEFDILDESPFGEGSELGTHVRMEIRRDSDKVLDELYREYGIGPEDYRFSRTVVPVRLAQYGNDKLVSRSQAKRLLAGLEKFENIVFDFEGVPTVGQAFADEIFRVYRNAHPGIQLAPVNMTGSVATMVKKALSS